MNFNGYKWITAIFSFRSRTRFKRQGSEEEQLACQYLQQQGLKAICQNWHSRFGEIDLIMQDKDTLVFVEVKARKAGALVAPEDAIDWRKQQKIIKTAQCYLQTLANTPNCRFDVVLMDGPPWQIRWLEHAFTA